MAFADLSLQGAIWRGLGLRCLLMPADIAASLCHPAAGQLPAQAGPQAARGAAQNLCQPAGQPSVNTAERTGAQAARPQGSRARPASRFPAHAADDTTRQTPARAADRPARPEAAPQAPRQSVWRPLPPQSWPPLWQARLQATRPGLVVWTYWQLGADICGADADAAGMAQRQARRALLQRILADLGHPGGTHTFWPACLPLSGESAEAGQPEEAFQPQADVFWSGVARLGARGVVVLGSEAARAVGLPASLRPPQQTRQHGHLVWVLPDVEFLLDAPQRYGSMLAFLQQALRQLVRR